ncbi:MAG: DUF421 domain-containing protein [Oscillospiraceae bacterium]|jgi:uncharacterized membrane protein YcaP (DUF421 family)|nr:DUF421 domain-containing protein [Oscillospiraceae bacterium]
MNYLIIAGSSAAVYLFVVVAIRLFGKKEIAQLSVIDLVFILLISNAVQNAMVGPDTSLLGGLCAAATLFAINALLKFLLYRFPKLSGVVQGHTVMLIYNGKTLPENLRKTRISLEEMEETVREHGVGSIGEVNLAVLEVDGNISVLSGNFQTQSSQKRRRRKKQHITPKNTITKNGEESLR